MLNDGPTVPNGWLMGCQDSYISSSIRRGYSQMLLLCDVCTTYCALCGGCTKNHIYYYVIWQINALFCVGVHLWQLNAIKRVLYRVRLCPEKDRGVTFTETITEDSSINFILAGWECLHEFIPHRRDTVGKWMIMLCSHKYRWYKAVGSLASHKSVAR